MAKTYNYVKFRNDFFQEPEIIRMRSFENGDTYIIIYMKMLLLQRKNGGIISFNHYEDTIIDEISLMISEDKTNINKTVSVLEEVGLLVYKNVSRDKFVLLKPNNSRNRKSNEYKQWRLSVFERDDYTCSKCGARGGKLNAHHIVPWAQDASKRYELDNGITLCEKCHKTIHKEMKAGNNNGT